MLEFKNSLIQWSNHFFLVEKPETACNNLPVVYSDTSKTLH